MCKQCRDYFITLKLTCLYASQGDQGCYCPKCVGNCECWQGRDNRVQRHDHPRPLREGFSE